MPRPQRERLAPRMRSRSPRPRPCNVSFPTTCTRRPRMLSSSLTQPFATAILQRLVGLPVTAKRISQAPLKFSGPTGTHTFRILPQPRAPKVVLYDQYDNGNGAATSSQDFEAANDPFDSFNADDFVVPAGQTWNITEVDAQGAYFNGAGPADSFHVFIYQDAGGLPGTLVYSATNQPYTGGPTDFVINLGSPACTRVRALIGFLCSAAWTSQ